MDPSNNTSKMANQLGPLKYLNQAQNVIDKGNQLADKSEKYTKFLIGIRILVTFFMSITLFIFIIVLLSCAVSIYKTVTTDYSAIPSSEQVSPSDEQNNKK